jgi:hypothetical protein
MVLSSDCISVARMMQTVTTTRCAALSGAGVGVAGVVALAAAVGAAVGIAPGAAPGFVGCTDMNLRASLTGQRK